MATATGTPATGEGGERLHTELKLVDAAAFSVGLIGPVGAIGLLGTGAALIIGHAVTLSFVFAVGAIRFLFFSGETKVPIWQFVIPVLGGAFVCYTIYRNVFAGHVGTFARLSHMEIMYLVIGLVIVLVAPGLAGRVRAGLAAGSVP